MSDKNGVRTRFVITFPNSTAANILKASEYYEERPATIVRMAVKMGLSQLGQVFESPALSLPTAAPEIVEDAAEPETEA